VRPAARRHGVPARLAHSPELNHRAVEVDGRVSRRAQHREHPPLPNDRGLSIERSGVAQDGLGPVVPAVLEGHHGGEHLDPVGHQLTRHPITSSAAGPAALGGIGVAHALTDLDEGLGYILDRVGVAVSDGEALREVLLAVGTRLTVLGYLVADVAGEVVRGGPVGRVAPVALAPRCGAVTAVERHPSRGVPLTRTLGKLLRTTPERATHRHSLT
jgi:hypothetical protein